MKNKRILVTGGAGFIGSHLCQTLAKDNDVVVLDDFSTGFHDNLAGVKAKVYHGSVRDLELISVASKGCDYVFHLAGIVGVPVSMSYPRMTFETNLGGTLNVLEAARQNGVKKVVFASSAAVYGDSPQPVKTEDLRPLPQSPYGITKLASEYWLAMYSRYYGVHTTSLRLFNVYGPRQLASSEYAAVVTAFVQRALRGEDLVIYGDGSATRDFVFVDDIEQAFMLATEKGEHEVFNIGSGTAITLQSLAEKVITLAGSQSKILHAPSRPGDILHSRPSIEKARKTLSFTPRTSLDDGLRSVLDYFQKQKPPKT